MLTHIEKQKLERALGMASGSVLLFSNRTFAEFFKEVVGITIYDQRYAQGSGSKANRMRAFWTVASGQELLKFLEGIMEGWELYAEGAMPDSTSKLLKEISARFRAQQHPSPQHPSPPPGRPITRFEEVQFLVALSFPGTKRAYVEAVAGHLKQALRENQVFYDHDFQAHLARPDLDTLLLSIYRERSSLVVVFLSADYAKSDWCGLEWRAVRDMIKTKSGSQLMFVRFDQSAIDGTLSIDGYIDAATHTPDKTAAFILQRIRDRNCPRGEQSAPR